MTLTPWATNEHCCKPILGIIYATIGVTSFKILRKYADSDVNYAEKGCMTLTQWATNEHCYKTIFGIIYATIGVTSVKILGKYADSDVNYAEKGFITLTPVANVKKNYFWHKLCHYLCNFS
jgi:hypothetical protein